MQGTHRQMTERNVNLTQEIISCLEKREKSKFSRLISEAAILERVRIPKTFQEGKRGKRNYFEVKCQKHQKAQEHLYNKQCKKTYISSILWEAHPEITSRLRVFKSNVIAVLIEE